MTPERVAALFTRSDGTFRFARWGRPLVPVIFGTDDATLTPLKDGIRRVAALGDLGVAETDPELGANYLMFFCRDWPELAGVPNLDRLIPDFAPLLDRLGQAGANQYRSFAFDEAGAIRLCTVLLRMDAALGEMPAEDLAMLQTVQSMALWSDTAFRAESPLGRLPDGGVIVVPEIAALIRAAYDPVLPATSTEPPFAARLAARAGLLLRDLE